MESTEFLHKTIPKMVQKQCLSTTTVEIIPHKPVPNSEERNERQKKKKGEAAIAWSENPSTAAVKFAVL